jgi:hypothetical protein
VRLVIGVTVGAVSYLTAIKVLRLAAASDLYALLRPYVRGWSRRSRHGASATSR